MTSSTTHAEFNDKTEGLEVAKAFAERIHGKTILITGVNVGGIGFTTAEAFASQSPAHVIVAGRSKEKLQKSINALKAKFLTVDYRPLVLDLSSQHAVRVAAHEVLSWSDIPAIDIIVNSAGIMCLPKRTLSEDGIEMHFATNHIGHYLFTCLIMPKLLKAAENRAEKGATRIVNVSSGSPVWAGIRWSDINFDKKNKDLPKEEQPDYDVQRTWGETGDLEEQSYFPLEGYNQSKVANILFGIALNKRLYDKYGILSVGLHPGIIHTELVRNMGPHNREAIRGFDTDPGMWRSAGAGSATSIVAALDPKLRPGELRNGKENYGAYLSDCQVSDTANSRATSSNGAELLWHLSETLVKEKFDW